MSVIPENIIIKYLQNRATDTEKDELNEWLKEDDKHAHTLYQMQSIWDSGKSLPQNIIDEKWDLLQTQILNEANERPNAPQQPEWIFTRLKPQIFQWMRYSAVLAIGILSSVVWFQLRTDLPETTTMLNHVIYNQQGSQNLTLPDQSSVWLRPNSQITYPEQFSDEARLVSLKGNAFFDIQKMEQAFVVQTENIEIKVTGTEFQVDNSFEKGLIVSLVSGQIEIHAKNELGELVSSTHLIAGQQACISEDGKLCVEDFDRTYVLSWKDGSYKFINEPIGNVIKLIAKHYQVKINISETLEGKNFTGKITPNMDLQEVMKIIAMSHPINYKITSDGIYIREK